MSGKIIFRCLLGNICLFSILWHMYTVIPCAAGAALAPPGMTLTSGDVLWCLALGSFRWAPGVLWVTG